jgi:hypothetical protein
MAARKQGHAADATRRSAQAADTQRAVCQRWCEKTAFVMESRHVH